MKRMDDGYYRTLYILCNKNMHMKEGEGGGGEGLSRN